MPMLVLVMVFNILVALALASYSAGFTKSAAMSWLDAVRKLAPGSG
jgi:hypothetical protein